MHSIPKEEVFTLVDYLNKHEYPAILVGTDTTAVINHKPIVDRLFIDSFKVTTIDYSIKAETVLKRYPSNNTIHHSRATRHHYA